MCRIAGIASSQLPIEHVISLVQEMCDSLKHGGPDDEGLFVDKSVGLVLGNRRLSLLDLTRAGHQPMNYHNYTITYNGELYNFQALKEELKMLGHHFSNQTDTEVILAAFAQWNSQAFSKLHGMYAFALWDHEKSILYLVRDPAGMKPLYYSTSLKGFAFASEIRAFGHVPFLQTTNSKWPVYLMAYGHIPEPVTSLAGVQPLKKGCYLKYNLDSCKSQIHSFAHFSYSEKPTHSGDIKSALQAKLSSAVDSHLVADANIGVFLSGGLDSGIIATLASANKKSKLNTLSLYFSEPTYSEKRYQDLTLQQLNCQSYQHLLSEKEFHDCFPIILSDMDMPSCDGINTWFISKYAKEKGLKAVLSGIGADELFGGYPSFNRIKIASLLQNIPAIAIDKGKRSNRKHFNRLSYLNMEGIKGVYLFLRGHFTPLEIARQLGTNEKDIWEILNEMPVLNDVSSLSSKNQASWLEFNMYMQNQLVRDADVMGMAHGLEIRLPFLDSDLVQFAMNIPSLQKYSTAKPKEILINSFRHLLPRQIWDRPKMGFSFPFAEWLKSSAYVKDLMNNSRNVTESHFKKFQEGKLHWSHMMSLIILRKRGVL